MEDKTKVHTGNSMLLTKFCNSYNGSGTGTPPITLFFGPGKIYRVIGKTVLKEE